MCVPVLWRPLFVKSLALFSDQMRGHQMRQVGGGGFSSKALGCSVWIDSGGKASLLEACDKGREVPFHFPSAAEKRAGTQSKTLGISSWKL